MPLIPLARFSLSCVCYVKRWLYVSQCVSVIGGLGGKDISADEFDTVLYDMQQAAAGERVVSPHLLYTQPEHEKSLCNTSRTKPITTGLG